MFASNKLSFNAMPMYLDFWGSKPFFVHLARVIAGIAGLYAMMLSIGKALPLLQRYLFLTTAWMIRVTGATGQLAAFIVSVGTIVMIIISCKAIYDTARVFMGTIKYIVQEAKYALNPWHRHSKNDLEGPDFENPFKW